MSMPSHPTARGRRVVPAAGPPGCRDNMPLLPEGRTTASCAREDEMGERARALQRIAVRRRLRRPLLPAGVRGSGSEPAHQRAFTQESVPYEMPTVFNVPTLSILAPTLLDFGTEEQKRAAHPADPPRRGAVGAVPLRAQRRLGPGRPRHPGHPRRRRLHPQRVEDLELGRLPVPTTPCAWPGPTGTCPSTAASPCSSSRSTSPGIEIQQIKMVNGATEFCQEFFDDVAIPASDVVGEVNDGWTVASRLLYHERDAVGGGSPYTSGIGGRAGTTGGPRRPGRPGPGHRTASIPACASWWPRLGSTTVVQQPADRPGHHRHRTGGPSRPGRLHAPPLWPPPATSAISTSPSRSPAPAGRRVGTEAGDGCRRYKWDRRFLMRQGGSLGGGSNEMQRNIISERVLGMPREYAADGPPLRPGSPQLSERCARRGAVRALRPLRLPLAPRSPSAG